LIRIKGRSLIDRHFSSMNSARYGAMSHSMTHADQATHTKIVIVALISAIVVTWVGIAMN